MTYQEQSDKLNEEFAFAEINERDTRIDELDVQVAARHGEFLLLNAPRLWTESSLEQKRRECSLKMVLIEPLKLV